MTSDKHVKSPRDEEILLGVVLVACGIAVVTRSPFAKETSYLGLLLIAMLLLLY